MPARKTLMPVAVVLLASVVIVPASRLIGQTDKDEGRKPRSGADRVARLLVEWSLRQAGADPKATDAENAKRLGKGWANPFASQEGLLDDVRKVLESAEGGTEAVENILRGPALDDAEKALRLRKLLGDVKVCPTCGKRFAVDYLFCPYDRAPLAFKPSRFARTVSLKLGRRSSLNLVLIPAGKFIMGSPPDEKGREPNETRHEVTISKPFYMGVMEVTWAQYEDVVGYPPNSFWLPKDPPVETVTWHQAMEFCKKLSQKTGRTFRLPTEAEWEYACRAGTSTRFNTGDALTTKQANYGGVYNERTTAASRFEPNAWGLYNMHGNVWEWCGDWCGEYPEGPVTDPKGPDKGQTRIMRGGSWFCEEASACRSARRQWEEPEYRYGDVGFRVVMEVHPP